MIVERQWQSVGTQLQIIDRLPKTTAALSLPVPIASRNWNSIETMCFGTFPQMQIQVSANTLPTSDDFRKYQTRCSVLGRLTVCHDMYFQNVNSITDRYVLPAQKIMNDSICWEM